MFPRIQLTETQHWFRQLLSAEQTALHYPNQRWQSSTLYGPLARYVKLRDAHAPGMPETFFPPPRVSDPDMYHGKCVTHVPWCMPESLTGGFLWRWWWGKRSRHSRRMRNPQFYVSGKRPMASLNHTEFQWKEFCSTSLIHPQWSYKKNVYIAWCKLLVLCPLLTRISALISQMAIPPGCSHCDGQNNGKSGESEVIHCEWRNNTWNQVVSTIVASLPAYPTYIVTANVVLHECAIVNIT